MSASVPTCFVWSLLFGACLLFFACLGPLADKEVAEKHTRAGDSLLVANQLDAARREYQRALEFDEVSIKALTGLGKSWVADKSWQSAISQFEKVLKYDPRNFEAHYYLGYCYREQARERYYLEKILSLVMETKFEKAQHQFDWILARDSLYSDILYQNALLYCYDHDYPRAVSTALRQIELKPQLRQAPIGLFKIYREYIAVGTSGGAPASVADPKSDYDRLFRAEWERRKGLLREAERDLLTLMQARGIVPSQMISQSLARLKAKEGRVDEIEGLVVEAINQIKSMGDADVVFEDIKYIVTDEELHSCQSVRSVEEAKGFFNGFWTKRNPNPTSRTNARIPEHYSRLVYAEENFEAFGPKTFAKSGGATWLLNFPQSYYLNEEFNDKGAIYLHHGKPDEKIITPSETRERNESWLYHATDDSPELLFDFHVTEGSRAVDWRLVPMFTNPALWSDRIPFSTRYSRLMMSVAGAYGGISGDRSMIEGTEEGKKEVSSGLSRDVTKTNRSVKHIESPISVSCYRGKNGKTAIDLAYVVSPAELRGEISDTLSALRVDAEFSMHNALWKRIADDQKTTYYNPHGKRGKFVIEIFHTLVPPDSYSVAWQATLLDGKVLISQRLQTNVPDFSVPGLQMSDIEPAFTIEPAKEGNNFNKGSLMVVPNPPRRYPLSRPVPIYFEVYNLSRSSEGKSAYTIDYELKCLNPQTSFIQRILGLGKKSSVGLSSTRQGINDWSPEHVDFDVQQLEPGQYELRVRVTDDVAKSSVSRSVRLELFE